MAANTSNVPSDPAAGAGDGGYSADHSSEDDSPIVLGPTDASDLLKAHSNGPLAIFGHADPVGSDIYNKKLSGRRAMAVYGLLTRDLSIWEELYSDTTDCGPKTVQEALAALFDLF